MGLYLKSGWYHYRRQIEGKIYYKALKLRRGQERLLSARLKQVEDLILARHFGLAYSPSQTVMLSDFIETYLKKKAHKKSLDRDHQRLIKIFEIIGDSPLSEIGKSHLEKLESRLLSGKDAVGTTTLNRYMELLRHLFNLAIDERIIVDNPLRHYEAYVEEEKGRALSGAEIAALLDAAETMRGDKRGMNTAMHDLILFGLNTGMRLSEILKLRRSYVKDGIVYYPMTETKSPRRVLGTRKAGTKTIVLNSAAREIIAGQKSSGDYVFALPRRDSNSVVRPVRMIRRLSGVKDFTFHQLRHTASTIIASESSLATAKAVLGHSDIRTTLKYTHPELDEQRKTVQKLGKRIRQMSGKR
ncbi:MAG: tyrosine-type recombinase/integrase [Candidatus Aminicenantales bacterium]